MIELLSLLIVVVAVEFGLLGLLLMDMQKVLIEISATLTKIKEATQ